MDENWMEETGENIPDAGQPAKRSGLKLGIVLGAILVLAAEALILGGVPLLNRIIGGGGSFGSSSSQAFPGGTVTFGAQGDTAEQGNGSSSSGGGNTASQAPVYGGGDVMKDGERVFNASLEKKLSEINGYIDQTFIFEVDSDRMLDQTIKGYVRGLDDVYSEYLTPKEYADTMDDSDGSYVGIGVAVQQDPKSYIITAMTVYPNSPAEQAGMEEGDILVKVDDQDISGVILSEVVSMIRGEPGTQVTVTVLRDGKYLDLVMTRKALEKITVETKMLEDGIGYIRLTEFDSVSIEQMRTAVADLKTQGMTKMVLDLRDNPGGLLTSVVTIADDFLPKANVFYVEDKQGRRTTYDAVDGQIWDGEMVVLINGNSASASEVLSGTLKDNGRATIMGTQSFGKGIVQTFFTLSDGSGIKLTTAHYFTPNGTDIHGVGITPDVEVEDDPETEADEPLDAAIDRLDGDAAPENGQTARAD